MLRTFKTVLPHYHPSFNMNNILMDINYASLNSNSSRSRRRRRSNFTTCSDVVLRRRATWLGRETYKAISWPVKRLVAGDVRMLLIVGCAKATTTTTTNADTAVIVVRRRLFFFFFWLDSIVITWRTTVMTTTTTTTMTTTMVKCAQRQHNWTMNKML